MYFDGAANHSETAIELGIRQMEVFGDSNLVLRQIQGEWKTRDVKAHNQFADSLATLASMIDIPVDATVRPLLIESRSAHAYCCLIDDTEIDDDLPWYHDIYHFLRLGIHLEAATTKDRRALRQDVQVSDTWGPHSRATFRVAHIDFMLAVLVWGIDIIRKISPKSSSGHEFILVAIDYFTKWVETTSYARLTSSGVASFIRSHIICRYGVPHELISDRGAADERAVEARIRISRGYYGGWSRLLGLVREAPICIVGLSDFFSHLYRRHTLLIDWAQAQFDQLNLLDERRLESRQTMFVHIRGRWPMLLKSGQALTITDRGRCMVDDLDGNRFSKPTNVDQLKRGIFIEYVRYWEFVSTHLGFDTHFASSFHISLSVHFASFVSLSTFIFTLASSGLIQLCSDYRDHAFDDGWFGIPRFLTYCASNATLGHIPFHLEVYGSSRLARSSSLTGCSPRRRHDRCPIMILQRSIREPSNDFMSFCLFGLVVHLTPYSGTFSISDEIMDLHGCRMFDDRTYSPFRLRFVDLPLIGMITLGFESRFVDRVTSGARIPVVTILAEYMIDPLCVPMELSLSYQDRSDISDAITGAYFPHLAMNDHSLTDHSLRLSITVRDDDRFFRQSIMSQGVSAYYDTLADLVISSGKSRDYVHRRPDHLLTS
ncbi:hypothetical protein CK203_108442 [Vitis vinifera]|uniref:Uncharacterized protein n=1 Tax=Vitis vinifera TaxID=29760 RepID=A0A438D6R8_VITVI|nr:hypothetical protein CK203_108442 [Vitis vinifera]